MGKSIPFGYSSRERLLIFLQSPAHVYYSNYTYAQLFSLLLLMIECCEDARKHHCAVFDKYTDKRYKRASQFCEGEMQKGFQVPDVASTTSTHFYDSRNGEQFAQKYA